MSNVKSQLRMTATSGRVSQNLAILFEDNATDAFDGSFDALFRGVNPDQIAFSSVSSDSTTLAIDQRPFPVDEKNIYLTFDFATDKAKVSIDITESTLPAGLKVYLEDLETGLFVDLRSSGYTFLNDVNAPKQRFLLHISNSSVSLLENQSEESIQAFKSYEGLVLKGELTDGQHLVEVMDMTGRIILSESVSFSNGRGVVSRIEDAPSIVRVWNGNQPLVVKTF